MQSHDALRHHYEDLHLEATRLAGGLNDLAQRAAVYHHIYEHSGGNHAFPLLAAHGALWARGYFRLGMRLGWIWSLTDLGSPQRRRLRLEKLAAFADAFRDINRRVCIETYTSYHFTAKFGTHAQAGELIDPTLNEALGRLHYARQRGQELPDSEKRLLFEAFFRHEQAHVVGPSIADAVSTFDWPGMRAIALRPIIRFSYFPWRRALFFRDFSQVDERICNGRKAFVAAVEVGWTRVEACLRRYEILSPAFFQNSVEHFTQLRQRVLAAA
jgi:hypothetical protein